MMNLADRKEERREQLMEVSLDDKIKLLETLRTRRLADTFDFKESWDNEKQKALMVEAVVGGITAKHSIKTIIETEPRPQIYHYLNGVYLPKAEGIIQKEIRECLGLYATNKWVSEIVGHIRGRTYINDMDFDTDKDWVSVLNGMLNIQTLELREHSPDFLTRVQLPVEFNINAECPRWMKFMEEVIVPRGEETTDEHLSRVWALQELMGYCLYKATPFHKAFMLTGEGSNGKSVFLETLTALLGKENVSSVPLQSFDYREYALSAMLGKLANIHSDLSDTALKHSGNFKLIVSGDGVFVNQKYKDPITTNIYAKQIFSANKVPETGDMSRAFFRRWIIINFPNRFEGTEDDKNLKETLMEELSGILNWALAGLQRLLTSGHFSYEPTVEEMELIYINLSSPVNAFVMECLEQKSDEVITKQDMYNAFVAYAKHKRIPSLTENAFSRKIKEAANPITEMKKSVDGQQVKCWVGWSLSTDSTHFSLLLSSFSQSRQQREKMGTIGTIDTTEEEPKDYYKPETPDIEEINLSNSDEKTDCE